MRSLRSRIHNLEGDSGAAAVEFAIIAVVLFMILFGIFEFGRVFSELEVMNGAAREGARVAAVGGTSAEIQDRIVDAAEPYDPDFNGYSAGACTQATIGDPVTVSWTENFEIAVAMLPTWNVDVDIRGVFRCEWGP